MTIPNKTYKTLATTLTILHMWREGGPLEPPGRNGIWSSIAPGAFGLAWANAAVFFLVRSGNIRCYVTNIYIYIPFMFQLCTYAPSKSLVQSMSFLFWWIMDCIHIFECMYRMGLYIIYLIFHLQITERLSSLGIRSLFSQPRPLSRPTSYDHPTAENVGLHPPRPRFDGPKGRVEVKKQQLCGRSRWAPKKQNNRRSLAFHWIYWLLKT